MMKDFIKEKRTIDLNDVSRFSFHVLLWAILIFTVPFFLIWYGKITYSIFSSILEISFILSLLLNLFSFMMLLFIGIVSHELLHGVIWALFAKRGFKSIRFGIIKDPFFAPYCHCKEPLLIKHYILGAISPALVLGVFPLIYACICGNLFIHVYGLFFFIAAAGDFMVIKLLIKEKNRNVLVLDHPSELGYYIYKKPNE
ncbi:MAG: DUF3267 domain-containing protein [Bacteroidales bacterium]|nr:DUF3267 domain-containing protein [Bacteroidales bacterium]